MEIKDINKHTSWYASYMEDDQGRALVLCQKKKIEQLNKLISDIKNELNAGDLEKAKELTNVPYIEHVEGYFKWIG